MTKPEIAAYLTKLGYSAEYTGESIVLWVNVPMKPGKKEKVRNTLRSIGYKGRWGWKMKKQEV